MRDHVHRTLTRMFLAAILGCLLAAPAHAQQGSSPTGSPDGLLSVETVGIEPTVGKSGEVVNATFRLRFRDLVREGQEVLILEDRMVPDRLPLAPFEAVGLDVDKRQIEDLHVWTFTYRVRIVGQNKGITTLPSIAFYWLVRDLGQSVEEAEVRQAASNPLQFRYVSTVTDDLALDIRDEIELGSFARRATLFRMLAWFVAPLPLVAWVISAGLSLRRRRLPQAPVTRAAVREEGPDPRLPDAPTTRQARSRLRRQIRALRPGHAPEGIAPQVDLVKALRAYLMAEVPNLNPGDMARDIRRHVQTTIVAGSRKEALDVLAGILIECQDELEQGVSTATRDPLTEEQRIDSALAVLHPTAQWRDRATRLLTRR